MVPKKETNRDEVHTDGTRTILDDADKKLPISPSVSLDLFASELRYRRLFETAQDGILILDGDTGEVIDANPFILDMLGYTFSYFIGKHLWELGFIKDKSIAQLAFNELKTNRYVRYEDIPLETKDGRSIDVEFISNVYEVGEKKIIQCNIRNIIERKLAEERLTCKHEDLNAAYEQLIASEDVLRMNNYLELAMSQNSLQESVNFLNTLIDNANAPFVIWDPSLRITRLNHAFEILIGRPAEEVIGKPLSFLFPPDQANHAIRLLETTLEGVRWETTKIEIQHRDGSIKTLLWNSSILHKPDGITPFATITQGLDITDQIRLEQEKSIALEQIQKNIAQLSILNDGIRNPLTIILAYIDMVGCDPEVIEKIILQVQRIDEIIKQLDVRWMQSVHVLNVIRKHYQIHTVPSSGENGSQDLK